MGESWRDSSKKARASVAHSDISQKPTSSRRWDGGIAAEEAEACAARGFRADRIAALAHWRMAPLRWGAPRGAAGRLYFVGTFGSTTSKGSEVAVNWVPAP